MEISEGPGSENEVEFDFGTDMKPQGSKEVFISEKACRYFYFTVESYNPSALVVPDGADKITSSDFNVHPWNLLGHVFSQSFG